MIKSYCDAINEAMIQEMERDSKVFTYGIGVPDHKKIFGSTKNLVEKFGIDRCFDTPLAEDSMTGFALGAALGGLKPVHVHIRVDFLLLAMNQLVNMISNTSYNSNGQLKAPLVIRAIVGRGWGQGCQHSKTLHSYFTHIPGLKVVAPTTPADAKGLLAASIRDESPVVFLEHRWLYWAEDEVPDGEYVVPLGKAAVLREGTDFTIIATSWMNVEAKVAADLLKEHHGLNVEIIDPRTLAPLDTETIINSVLKTERCLVVDNDWKFSGYGAELSATVAEECFYNLELPVKRLGFKHTPCPTVRCLENEFYPNAIDIMRSIENMMGLTHPDIKDEDYLYTYEHKFKGPF